jgi:chitinase
METRFVTRSAVALAMVLAFSGTAVAAPSSGSAPSAPTNLRITASSATSVSLAWNASTSRSSNWWYCVQRDGQGCYRVNPPQTTWTFPNLLPNTTFRWTVVALDSSGKRSAPSNQVTYTTPPDTTPPGPTPVITITSVVPTRISLTWTAAKDNTSQVWYTLLLNGTPQFTDYIGLQRWTALYLTPSTTYTFQVRARDAYGNTVQSAPVSRTTPPKNENVPPSVPTNLRFSFQTSPPEAWLEWNQSTDNFDPQSQILYEVFVDGVLAPEATAIGYGEGIAYCRTFGAPNTFAVRAVDTSGNASAFSNQLVMDC